MDAPSMEEVTPTTSTVRKITVKQVSRQHQIVKSPR